MGDCLMKLAVIFIGTGKYLDFLPTWYDSCETYLVPNVEKEYFVFTDGELSNPPENMIPYYQEHLSWPYITLHRWKIVLRAKEDLEKFDYVLFLDADMRIVSGVSENDLLSDKKYIGVHHPCHYLKMPPHDRFPGSFETNSNSKAKVSEDYNFNYYWQGCLWGGRVPHVLDMVEELNINTSDDEENNYVAKWHDESHLNAFYSKHYVDVHTLGPQFAYPEVFSNYCNFDPIIVHLSKDNSKYQQ
jgi:hypothetical protein